MPTITIESTRLISAFDMEVLLGSVVAIVAIACMALVRLRHHRQR